MIPAVLGPLLLYAAAVAAVIATMLGLSALLGERHRGRATDDPYESGILPTGRAGGRYPARFYMVALLFVVFDLEAVFLFAWALAAEELGLTGYLGLLAFVAVLVVGLIYEWRQGALDWGPGSRERSSAREARA